MSNAHTSRPSAYTHALRITVSFDGPKLEIARVERVRMRVPAAPATAPKENQGGYWVEVRGGDGTLLHHFPLHDPTRRDVESFGDEPGDPMRRHPARTTKGEFEVLIPDLPGAQSFRLHGPKPDARAKARAAAPTSGPLVEHSFDDLRRLAGRAAGQGGTP